MSYDTWLAARREHAELSDLVDNARIRACDTLKNALFESAKGHTVTVHKAMKLREVTIENGKRTEVERIEPYTEEQYIPPNFKAAQYLLARWDKKRYSATDPAELDIKQEELKLKQDKADGW